ncbi:hypothetical protein [Virgisporangium aurantiacum]|uniref:Lipoprotein n=1 Tax=Virgisporangium aurantiacum TaxID=175570 RepID=A0A8J4E4D6_9ACTN|nr:hypothetical protein [Virgisporangium aurantiacum]GIJ61840.1 hypothetical protein Vau01_093560 [Virgisporangium aurantiacum]
MSGKLRPLAALAMVALMGAGCSNSPAETGTANDTATSRERAMKFAQCMRDNGVKDFPDPGPSGELTVDGVLNGTSLDPNTAVWKSAISACKDLEPPGFTGQKRSAEEQKAALRFAQCMRDNGVKDFPDPSPESPLIDTNRIPSAATKSGMDALNAAGEKCGEYSKAAGVKADGKGK